MLTVRREWRGVATPVVIALAALSLLSGSLLSGCAAEPAAPILQPGAPGEPNRVPSAQDIEQATTLPTPNDADVRYMQMMVPHHRQALDMSALAAGRAESPQVLGLAERISVVQTGEIAVMTAWLGEHDTGPAGHGEHTDHSGMPGMATADQLTALAAARGAGFDRMFLELMTAHHGGAVTMATDVLGAGAAIEVEQLATDVLAEQTVEIDRMRRLLPS